MKPLTFSPTCKTCLALLAEGKRTGLEPHPETVYKRGNDMRRQIRGEAFDAMLAAKRRQRKAAAALPIHRRHEA